MLDSIVNRGSSQPKEPVDFSYYSAPRGVTASGIFERILQPTETYGDNVPSFNNSMCAFSLVLGLSRVLTHRKSGKRLPVN